MLITFLVRRLTKQVQEARNDQDEEKVKLAVTQYDEEIERFIPILMQQAKIYWEQENYNQVEKIFRKSVEFCNDHDVWKLNVAHVLFMQVPTEGESSAQSSHKLGVENSRTRAISNGTYRLKIFQRFCSTFLVYMFHLNYHVKTPKTVQRGGRILRANSETQLRINFKC